MSTYVLRRQQIVKLSPEKAWDFFSSPKNLEKITPQELSFNITDISLDRKCYPGQMISYTVKPILGIPLKWVTEITHVKEPHFFVDEQRVGPYSMWHHEHHFRQVEDGIEMTDIVHYKLPLGILGRIAHRLFVKKQLNQIFDYRMQAMEKYFNGDQVQ